MKKIFGFLLFAAVSAALLAADMPESRKLFLPGRQITFYKIDKSPVLDGDFSDECWKGIPVWDEFQVPQVAGRKRGTRVPPLKTEVRLGFDRWNMYFAFRCYDPEAKALPAGEKPSKEWNGELVSMFFAPRRPDSDMQQAVYYCTGSKHLTYRGKAPKLPFRQTWGHMRSAVRFFDGYWQIEAVVPFNNLEFNPFEDKGMRGQICRGLEKTEKGLTTAVGDAFYNMFEPGGFRDFFYTSHPMEVTFAEGIDSLPIGKGVKVPVVMRNISPVRRPARVCLALVGADGKRRYYQTGLYNLDSGESRQFDMTCDILPDDRGICLLANSKEGYIHYDSGVLNFAKPGMQLRAAALLKSIDALAAAGVSSRLDGWRKEFAVIPALAEEAAWKNLEQRLTYVEDAVANFRRYQAVSKDKQAFLDKDYYLASYTSLDKIRDHRRLTPGFTGVASVTGAGGETVNFQASAIAAGDKPVMIEGVRVVSPFPATVRRVADVETNRSGNWPDWLSARIARVLDSEERICNWWVTIQIPRGTPAGTYQAHVVFNADDNAPTEILPVVINVYGFDLPERSERIVSTIASAPQQGMKAMQLKDIYESHRLQRDLVLSYGITAMRGFENPENVGEGGWTPDRNVKDIIKLGGIYIMPGIPWWHYMDTYVAKFAPEGMTKAKLLEQIRQDFLTAAERFKKEGINPKDVYIYYDELDPSQKDLLEFLINLKKETGFSMMACFDKSYVGYDYVKFYSEPLDLLAFNSSFFLDPKWREQLHELQKNGKTICWYLNSQIGFATFNNIAIPAYHHRTHYWQLWKYKVDGTLYWGLCWWGAQEFANRPLPRVPGDGNGILAYPEDQTLAASVRLEILRESLQDYLYLETLDNLVKAKPDAPAAARARKALELNWISDVMTELPADADVIRKAKAEIAQLILEMKK
ncbi:MAG: DUF4091 domain-containing protein [Victivallales bacterium]|nr:DUF4091 domain-containing protein [Victivallales bacterium]